MTLTRRLFNGLVLGFALSFGFLGQRRLEVEAEPVQPIKSEDHNLWTHFQTELPDGTSLWTTNEDFMAGLWFDDGRQDTFWTKWQRRRARIEQAAAKAKARRCQAARNAERDRKIRAGYAKWMKEEWPKWEKAKV